MIAYSDHDKDLLLANTARTYSRLTFYKNGQQLIVCTEDDYLQEWDYEDYRYVPDQGFVGQFVERILDGKLINLPLDIDISDAEFKMEVGIKDPQSETVNYYDYGNFLITKVSDTDTNGTVSFEACDYTKKFNKVYEDRIECPCLAVNLLEDVCNQAGVELGDTDGTIMYAIPLEDTELAAGTYSFKNGSNYLNFTTTKLLKRLDSLVYDGSKIHEYNVELDGTVTDTVITPTSGSSATGTVLDTKSCAYNSNFAGWNFVVENNQFEENKTLRDVVKAIAQLGATWARVGIDNKLHLDFTMGDTPDTYATMGTDNYYSATKTGEKYGPVTDIVIGMSNVEGENISYIAPATDGTTVEDTDIYVDDVDSSKRSQWALEGNAYQATSEASKNLLPTFSWTKSHQGIDCSYSGGILTYSGTAGSNLCHASDEIAVNLPAGRYWFSTDQIVDGVRPRIRYTSGGSTSTAVISSTTKKVSINPSEPITMIQIRLGDMTSGTAYSGTIKLQLEQGTDATGWVEPKDASPSPSNPSEVEVVTGDNEIVIANSQLLKRTNEGIYDWTNAQGNGTSSIASQIFNDVPTVNNQNGVRWTKTTTSTDWQYLGFYQNDFRKLLYDSPQGTKFTISFDIRVDVTTNKRFQMLFQQGNAKYGLVNSNDYLDGFVANEWKHIEWVWTRNDQTTLGNQMLYFNTYNIQQDVSQIDIVNVKVEYGENASPYEPYQSQTYLINLGVENLFDGEIELGSINAATGELISNNSRTRSKNYTKVKPNTTYYFKGTITSGNRWIIGYKADKTAITDGTFSSSNPASVYSIYGGYAGDKFTTTATTEYIKWYDTNSTDLTELVEITKGSTPQYISDNPIELCKINNYKDRIFKTSGKNLFDEMYTDISTDITYKPIYVGDGDFTLSTTMPLTQDEYHYSNLFFLSGNVTTGASTSLNGVSINNPKTQTSIDGYVTIAYRIMANINPVDYNTQLEKGNQVNEYEPYGSGKWYLSKEVRKLQLNISNMNNNEDYPGWINQTQIKNDYPNVNDTLGKFTDYLCNIGTKTGLYIAQNPVGVNTMGSGQVFLNKNYFNLTQTQWKTNYPNLVFTLYYGLQTPEIIEITNTELIGQLNALYNAKLFDGINNISTTTANLPPILEFLYNSSNTELAIYDNPLTYTEELRSIAIHYAKRLVGLEYTPAEVDTIGYPWLDGDDYCEINDLDEDTYYTYPFNRVITYKGYLDSSIKSIADGKVQTEYKYEGDVDRRIKHTEIIVDKHEGEIRLINENVDTVENNLSELEGQYSDVLSQIDTANTNITQLSSRVDTVQTSTYTKTQIQQIVNGTGVDGVKVTAVSTTEAKFDKDGMHYSKTDAPTSSTINELGLEVDAVDDDEVLLYAGYDNDNTSTTYGQSIVKTANLTVSNWTVVGTHGRFEKFSDGTNPEGVGFFLV